MTDYLLAQPGTVPFSRPQTPHVPHGIGFIGLGSMGYFMARNLARRKPLKGETVPLHIWNRSVTKSEKLLQELGPGHIRVAQSIEQIATECDIVFTCLANDDVVTEVYERIAKALLVSGLLSHSAVWTNTTPSQNDTPVRRKIFVETSTVCHH
jgi:3-hydroxyisobutyrate dehydrogenase-like beta-hydroxyacid dehydrogenase